MIFVVIETELKVQPANVGSEIVFTPQVLDQAVLSFY